MAHVANGGYEMVGTFNGNPLAMAATRAMLTEVATPEAYQRIERSASGRSPASSGDREDGLAAHVVAAGAKGCVVFAPEPVRDYRGFLGIDDRYSHAHWLFQHNGGVFLPPWGKIEQWLISVQHDEADIDRWSRTSPRSPPPVTGADRGRFQSMFHLLSEPFAGGACA